MRSHGFGRAVAGSPQQSAQSPPPSLVSGLLAMTTHSAAEGSGDA